MVSSTPVGWSRGALRATGRAKSGSCYAWGAPARALGMHARPRASPGPGPWSGTRSVPVLDVARDDRDVTAPPDEDGVEAPATVEGEPQD